LNDYLRKRGIRHCSPSVTTPLFLSAMETYLFIAAHPVYRAATIRGVLEMLLLRTICRREEHRE